LGTEAKKIAEQRFNIERFVSDWKHAFQTAINLKKINYEKTNSIY